MSKNFFQELGVKSTTTQAVMIDYITEEAPILAMLPMMESSDATSNKYEVLEDADGATLNDFNSELPILNAATSIRQIDLQVLGGNVECTFDAERQWGSKETYLQTKLPHILGVTGEKLEKTILYDSFRKTCIDYNGKPKFDSKRLIDAGGTGSTNYSIIAVKYKPGVVTGLYNPADGGGFDMGVNWKWGGGFGALSNGKDGYVARLSSYVGMQIANPKFVCSIVNNDILGTKVASKEQLCNAITNVRGKANDTFLYMHPAMRDYICANYKDSVMQVPVQTKDLNYLVDYFNGIRIITSHNFQDGDEAHITV